MHPHLSATIDAFTSHFSRDPRCLALQLKGSGGAGTDDEYSDVDLELIVDDREYAAVSAELRPLCERTCGRIELWFPEGIRPDSCNYAFLFEHGGEQFLYDFAIATRSNLLSRPRRSGRVLLDPTGLLDSLRTSRSTDTYVPDRLPRAIEHYWLYAYLSGKYTRRGDILKLLYVQQTIFRTHLDVLRALHPDSEWGWWPKDVARLPAEVQASLLRYFTPPSLDSLRDALGHEVQAFSADARDACSRWSRTYPDDLERFVIRHLHEMGAIPSDRA